MKYYLLETALISLLSTLVLYIAIFPIETSSDSTRL